MGRACLLKGQGTQNRAGQHNYNRMFLWQFCFYREALMCSSPLYAVNVLLPLVNKEAALGLWQCKTEVGIPEIDKKRRWSQGDAM